ncbi:hypothetical protein ACFFKH_14930 [Micromonospora marina]
MAWMWLRDASPPLPPSGDPLPGAPPGAALFDATPVLVAFEGAAAA